MDNIINDLIELYGYKNTIKILKEGGYIDGEIN